jgi:glycosyltransferase involved in cell wall biosynthesis
MERKRLLFISHSADFYGAERSLLDILKHIDKTKFEIYLVCPKQGYLVEQATIIGLKVFIINYERWLLPQPFAWRMLYHIPINIIASFRIAKIIRKIGVELTYTNSAVAISGALASKLCNVRHIWHLHETIGKSRNQFYHILGRSFIFVLIDKLASKIITNSYKIKAILPQEIQYKASVVYNGFCVKRVDSGKTKNSESRMRTQSADQEPIIAIVGNLSERKGQKEGILAMPMILRKFSSAKLLIVGKDSSPDQAYLKLLESLVKQYSLASHIEFVGYQQDVDHIYKKADLLLVPSSDEPFGRIIVEAMLAGVPVIASAVGGIPEIIEPGKNGILLQSREPFAIAQAVIGLLGCDERRRELAAAALGMARQRFNMNSMIEKIENTICEVIGRKQDTKKDYCEGFIDHNC